MGDRLYVRQTCSVLEINSASVVLGADIEESAAGICARVSEQRAMIATVDHAATELVLTRSRADVAKLSYWLRCYVDVLGGGGGTADRFDRELRAALSGTLGGDISDTAWWQAGLGVDQGGLGLRPAAEVALPAFIASRLASRPAVEHMCGHMQEGALGAADALLRVYDARTDAAIGKYVATLPQVMHEEITRILMHGQAQAEVDWKRCRDGFVDGAGPSANPDDDDDDARHHGSSGAGLVNCGRRSGGRRASAVPVSSGHGPKYSAQSDSWRELLASAWGQVSWTGSATPAAHMTWAGYRTLHTQTQTTLGYGALVPEQGRVLEDREFVEAVWLRLGVGGPPDTATCGLCGNSVLEPSGAHPACWATGEATRGHNRVRNIVHEISLIADASAEREPL